jgi:glycosyltransferase involved in cell wall biosynthesis
VEVVAAAFPARPRITCAVISTVSDGVILGRTLASIAANGNAEATTVRNAAELRALIGSATGDFLSIVREGEIVAPNAFQILLAAMAEDPLSVGAHAYWVPLEADGRVSRLDHRAHRRRVSGAGSRAAHHAVPTFRLDVLTKTRLAGDTMEEVLQSAAAAARSNGGMLTVQRSLSGSLPSSSRPAVRPATRSAALPLSIRKIYVRTFGRASPYEMLTAMARRIPMPSMRRSVMDSSARAGKIGYVLAQYPALSETFIRREIIGVRAAGVDLEVVAMEPASSPMIEDPDSPSGHVHYYGRLDTDAGRAAARELFLEHPLRVVRAWLCIMRRQDSQLRTFWRDRDLLLHAAQLAVTLRALNVTHVHAAWASKHALSSFVASHLLGVPFSVQARASEVNRRLERVAIHDRIANASFIVSSSEFIASSLREAAGARSLPPVHVNYDGLDLQRFVPRRPARTSGSVRLIAVGRLIEAKGFRHLLAACDTLRKRGHSFTCEIIGGADAHDPITWIELRRMHDELQLYDCVSFTGPVGFTGVLAALGKADVFVLPCVEGHDGTRDVTPNSLLEAMATGLPVVSTRSGAIPEIVEHDVSGILVDPGDDVALASAIERLLLDASLRDQVGLAARRRVEQAFDSRFSAMRLAELFRGRR